jgi:L,D-peptidoglycan transpeptidase YkuD (ErfK/YbiS/YcfS/YnhG family)
MTTRKREGDGKSPMGKWNVTVKYYRADRWGKIRGAKALKVSDGWCDDMKHGLYNQPVQLPFKASHEVMTRSDSAYDIVFATDHNQRPRVLGGGSAIFFHLIAKDANCTAGCVAVSLQNMRKILGLSKSKITLAIGMSAAPRKSQSQLAHG